MQFHSWNVQGKNLEKLDVWMEEPREESLDIVVLQEVAALHDFQIKREPSLKSMQLQEFVVGEDSELVDYRVYGTCDVDSHLGQVILLDNHVVDHVKSGYVGGRCIDVTFHHAILQCDVFVLGCHFPHKNTGDEKFQEALLELIKPAGGRPLARWLCWLEIGTANKEMIDSCSL